MKHTAMHTAQHEHHLRYSGTLGVRSNGSCYGFLPAFQDIDTGETHLSTAPDGSIATIHLLDGLPSAWIVKRDAHGRVTRLKDSIIAGFVRNGRFLTREELANRRCDA